jgi:prepilin-type N-terminal cleavage/methylation domain-containing protein
LAVVNHSNVMAAPRPGFTLIEIAVVIAIVAILAAVAIPRFGDVQASAERANINDFTQKLKSAYSIYAAENAGVPTTFTQFVSTNGVSPAGFTISIQNLAKGGCTLSSPITITCPVNQFPNLNQVIIFTINPATETITSNVT